MKRTIALFVTITGVEDQQAARRLTVLLAVMISALILRSAFLALAVTEQGIESLSRATPDSRAYLLMAGNLHGSGQPAESQFFDFGIGYALFLAATLPLEGGVAGDCDSVAIVNSCGRWNLCAGAQTESRT